jgi:hypothetical protein
MLLYPSSLDFYRRGRRSEAHAPGLSHSHASDVVHRAAVIPLMERVYTLLARIEIKRVMMRFTQ